MRLLRIMCALSALLVVGGPRSSSLAPIIAERISIRSAPVTLQSDDPARVRTGQLTLEAGWELSSSSRQFGGWSALAVNGDDVTAIGDYGSVLRFRLTPFGRAVAARIDPLPDGCGEMRNKHARDSESLARTTSSWLIGFEVDDRLCRVTADFTSAQSLVRPPEMRGWDNENGAEAIVRLADGRVLAFAERAPDHDALRPLLVFAQEPGPHNAAATVLRYLPPKGFSPTDAAQLPDGRIIVLHRSFGVANRFTSMLTTIDLADLDGGKPVSGEIIAGLAPPTLHDNFEGLAVTIERGQTFIWLLSDDNFMSWQATYLLKFRLDAWPTPPR